MCFPAAQLPLVSWLLSIFLLELHNMCDMPKFGIILTIVVSRLCGECLFPPMVFVCTLMVGVVPLIV